MKPRTISIAIERVVEAGPITLGLSDIKVVPIGLNGSTLHAASVVVTAALQGGPQIARRFQTDVIEILRAAYANAEEAKAAIDAVPVPAPSLGSNEVSTEGVDPCPRTSSQQPPPSNP